MVAPGPSQGEGPGLGSLTSHSVLFRSDLWFQAIPPRALGDLGFPTSWPWVVCASLHTPPAAGRQAHHRLPGLETRPSRCRGRGSPKMWPLS